jgi:hypothetical protein
MRRRAIVTVVAAVAAVIGAKLGGIHHVYGFWDGPL